MKIKIYKGKDGDWHIRISGRNNRILLDAAGYNTKRNALKSMKAVLAYATAGNYSGI
jgi:uncharacterized protein YegP (UPF0339 family)